jgi:hypothetical protein
VDAPKIFWSWQNDYAPNACRYFIRDALFAATDVAGKDLGLQDAERPEVDQDTQNTPGMVDIIATILKKISQSAVFVADVTPVGSTDSGKALPNPNVLLELGWALNALGPDRIIAIINTASGFTPDDLPFDIRHRRAMPYTLDENADSSTRAAAKKSLIANLTYALTANLASHIETAAASQVIEGVAAKPNNPSIWATATDRIESHDSFVTGQKQLVSFPDCPRAYIRIIPASWENGPPPVHSIAAPVDPLVVWPPLEGGGNGNYGACEEGFVRYWFTAKNEEDRYETRNVTMYFDTSGEFWTVHGTAVDAYKYGPSLRYGAVVYWWAQQ